MPQNIALAMFVLGGVLLLLALSSGGFKIFGAEMSGASGRWSRLAAGVFGLGLIGAATLQELKARDDKAAAAPGSEAVASASDPAGAKKEAVVPQPTALAPPAPVRTASGAAAEPPSSEITLSAQAKLKRSASVPAEPQADVPPPPSRAAPPPPRPAPAPAQPINVQCTSQGQVCDRTADITGPFPDSLTIRAGEGCSSVKYTVRFLRRGNGFSLEEISTARTRALAGGEAETLRVDPRATSARISAEGVLGGCNTGRLGSWNVIAEPGG